MLTWTDFFPWKIGNSGGTKLEPQFIHRASRWVIALQQPTKNRPKAAKSKDCRVRSQQGKEKYLIALQVQAILLMSFKHQRSRLQGVSLQGTPSELPGNIISCFQCTTPVQNSLICGTFNQTEIVCQPHKQNKTSAGNTFCRQICCLLFTEAFCYFAVLSVE